MSTRERSFKEKLARLSPEVRAKLLAKFDAELEKTAQKEGPDA